MSQKTILIIGAGFGQLPAILRAKELGMRVICADANPNALGMPLADESHVIDVKDEKALLALAKSCGVDGVMTMQSDLPMPAVGRINSELGLRGVDRATAMRCSNKDQTRKALAERGLPQPEFRIVRDAHDAMEVARELGFPVVVKAPDSSGSRGVTRANRDAEIGPAFDEAMRYSRSGQIVVEKFIVGVEIGAQTFSVDGHCVVVLPHDDQVSEGEFMVPTGHSYPLERPGIDLAKVENQIRAAVEALGIDWGPSNVDVILGEDGNAHVIEIGARIGATCLPELTSHYLGQDWVELTVRSAVGEDVEFREPARRPCAAKILTSPKDGIFREAIVPEWVRDHPGLLELELTARSGDEVSQLRKGTDRIGKVFVAAASGSEAVALADSMEEAIQMVVD